MKCNELQWILMNYNELQLELIGGNCMEKIAMVKKEVQLQNWSDCHKKRHIKHLDSIMKTHYNNLS